MKEILAVSVVTSLLVLIAKALSDTSTAVVSFYDVVNCVAEPASGGGSVFTWWSNFCPS